MINKLYNYLTLKANMGNIFIAIIIQTLFQLILVLYLSPELNLYSRESIPDLRIYLTGGEIFSYLNQLGEEGRNIYMYFILIDLIYPFAYSTSFLLLFVYLGAKAKFNQTILEKIIFLPIFLFIFDLLENSGNLIILKNFPKETFLNHTTGYFTLFKQIFLLINILSIGMIGLIALKSQLYIKKK